MENYQIKLKLLYFAKIKEILNNKSFEIIDLTVDNLHMEAEMKVCEIYDLVKKSHPEHSKELDSVFVNCLIAINDEYISEIELGSIIKIKNLDEISFIPPISSG